MEKENSKPNYVVDGKTPFIAPINGLPKSRESE